MLQALILLKQNNKLYESITIDENLVEQLPEESYLDCQVLRSIQINLFIYIITDLKKTKKIIHLLKHRVFCQTFLIKNQQNLTE